MNIPNVNAVQQQTQMAESMVSRNAVLAEESIRSAEQTESDLVCNLHRMFTGGRSMYWPTPGRTSALPGVNADNAEFSGPTTGSCYLMQDIDTLYDIITAQSLIVHSSFVSCTVDSLHDLQLTIVAHKWSLCRAAEATAAEARRKYEAAKLAADEAERARLAAEGLSQEAQARESSAWPMRTDLLPSMSSGLNISPLSHHTMTCDG